jgi:hypothetical protein
LQDEIQILGEVRKFVQDPQAGTALESGDFEESAAPE